LVISLNHHIITRRRSQRLVTSLNHHIITRRRSQRLVTSLNHLDLKNNKIIIKKRGREIKKGGTDHLEGDHFLVTQRTT